jgi:amino acid permease
MRSAKQVKVIHRWKAEDDGEIPIGEDEMLGTAMNLANNMGNLQGIVEDSMSVIQPITWFAFYGGGGFVAGNTVGHYLDSGAFEANKDLKFFATRLTYITVSGITSVAINGTPTGMGETIRAGGVGLGSFLIASLKTYPAGTMKKYGTRLAIAAYGASTISYAITKYKNR